MPFLPVQAGRDHLEQFARRNPVDAVAELVWNSLDAEADSVEVTFETVPQEKSPIPRITKIVVHDTGHGISPDKADAFLSLGDSWKKNLNGQTLNRRRPLHGSRGRGRFYSYSLGNRALWSSVSHSEMHGFRKIEIQGDRNRINGFNVSEPVPASGPTGTKLTISVEGRPLSALLDDLPNRLAARLAGYLLGNPEVSVRANGQDVDPKELIDGNPLEVPLSDLPASALDGREVPIMTIVDWNEGVREAPGVVLCNQQGLSLFEVDTSAPTTSIKRNIGPTPACCRQRGR